jgi:hypothetical protein
VQGLLSSTTAGEPDWQLPAAQASPTVHALLSLQVVPSGAVGLEQKPVEGLHVPATWQASDAVHVVPAQRFAVVQASVLLHAMLE